MSHRIVHHGLGNYGVARAEDEASQAQLHLQSNNVATQEQGYDVEVKLLNLFPVKNSHVTVTQRSYVIPVGRHLACGFTPTAL